MSNGAAVFATELKSPKTEAEARAALHDPAWLNKVFVRDPSTISFILRLAGWDRRQILDWHAKMTSEKVFVLYADATPYLQCATPKDKSAEDRLAV